MNPITEAVRQRQAAETAARREALRKQLAAAPHVKAFAAFLLSPAGAPLMKWMEEQFVFGDLAGGTVEETYFNLGQRELVLELRRLGTLKERTGDDADEA